MPPDAAVPIPPQRPPWATPIEYDEPADAPDDDDPEWHSRGPHDDVMGDTGDDDEDDEIVEADDEA